MIKVEEPTKENIAVFFNQCYEEAKKSAPPCRMRKVFTENEANTKIAALYQQIESEQEFLRYAREVYIPHGVSGTVRMQLEREAKNWRERVILGFLFIITRTRRVEYMKQFVARAGDRD